MPGVPYRTLGFPIKWGVCAAPRLTVAMDDDQVSGPGPTALAQFAQSGSDPFRRDDFDEPRVNHVGVGGGRSRALAGASA